MLRKKLAKNVQKNSMRKKTSTGLAGPISLLGAAKCGGVVANVARTCRVVNSANMSTKKRKRKSELKKNLSKLQNYNEETCDVFAARRLDTQF